MLRYDSPAHNYASSTWNPAVLWSIPGQAEFSFVFLSCWWRGLEISSLFSICLFVSHSLSLSLSLVFCFLLILFPLNLECDLRIFSLLHLFFSVIFIGSVDAVSLFKNKSFKDLHLRKATPTETEAFRYTVSLNLNLNLW